MGNPPLVVPPEKSSTWASIAREFYVDLLGSLLPGLLFTLTAAFPAWWSASLAWRAARSMAYASTIAAPDALLIAQFRSQFRVELWCLLFVLSYVLGCVFYRRDPKVPDQRSAAYILWRDVSTKPDSIVRCVIQPAPGDPPVDSSERARVLAEGEGGQFPYSHLYEYLDARGLRHLADIVPWRGNKKDSHGLRTKMFINLLKVRLQYLAPNKCSEIVRNEAHIRMMSSVWYAAVTLQELCYVAAIPAIAAMTLQIATHGLKLSDALEPISLLFFLATLVLAAGWLRMTIRRFFHYQRVREILYVLETAYWAKETCPSILEHLS